jgi:HEAT repeat protein
MVKNLSDKLVTTIGGRYRRSVTLFSARGRGTPILSMAVRCFAAAAVALLAALSHARAQELAQDPAARARVEQNLAHELGGCPDLPECLAILDAFVSPRDHGAQSGVGRAIADHLRRFGQPAKQELLGRAVGAHLGWRNLAGDILSYWGDWSPSDVPAIRAALQLQHGGWIARPLAEIETHEAILALVEDLAVIGSMSQTGWALVKIGPKSLPYLLPILANDRQTSEAASVIREMGREALVAAPDWASVAASTDNPKDVRLAALRGLAAMGRGARHQGKDLRQMLATPEAEIRAQVYKTLVAIRDPSVVTAVAENCNPTGTAFHSSPFQSRSCLIEVAAFGEDARTTGPQLIKFLVSPNGEELATAVTALGFIGYDAVIPQTEQQLRSPDWRIVYAAARSLGWLGAQGSLPELERVAYGHWLPEVRGQARTAIDALKGTGQRMVPPSSFEGRDGTVHLFFVGRSNLRSVPSCGSQRWEWHDVQFSLPPPRVARLSLGAGELIGSNRGEWGGELVWQPADGQAQPLIKHNVVAIEAAEDGAIVLFGLAHMGLVDGYAVRISQRDDGGWSLSEVARLPSTADALARIGPNLFAAWSEHRVVVFSDKEIVGLAKCIEK